MSNIQYGEHEISNTSDRL